MLFPLLYIKNILLAIGQDPQVVDIAVIYIYYCIPGVFLNAFSMQNVLYCALLESTKIFVYEGIVSNVTHISMLILCVGYLDMGFTGLAIASSAQFISRWVCSMLFMKFCDNKKITDHATEPFFSAVTFSELGHQARMSINQCVMGVWNWWGLEVFTLFAGYVSTTALAAQAILRAVSMLAYMVPVGLRMATQITIGKSVGAQNSSGIKKYYRTSLEMGAIYALIMATVFMTCERSIFGVFTHNEEVMAALASTWLMFTLFCMVD